MRCPTCGTTSSDVLETRKWLDDTYLKRTRVCHNGHRFQTFEISHRLYKTMARYAKVSAKATIKEGDTWKRDKTIVRLVLAGARIDHTAEKYGLSPTRVGQIVKRDAP